MLLAALGLASLASSGDRAMAFLFCVDECVLTSCGGWGDFWAPTPALALFDWTCQDECDYGCMWNITNVRSAHDVTPLKYHGKWPFFRLWGVQEPASAALALLNAAAHAHGLRSCWRLTRSRGGWVWRGLGLVAVQTWLSASLFHVRDAYLTQCADYFSATLLMGASTVAAAAHLAEAVSGRGIDFWVPPLAAAAAVGFALHVRRMLDFFDFGHHLRANLALGGLHLLLWLLWWARTRRRRPHAWRAPAINAAVGCASCALELADFPPPLPLLGVLDAHAMWHASTVPLALAYWHWFVARELRWRAERVTARRRPEGVPPRG